MLQDRLRRIGARTHGGAEAVLRALGSRWTTALVVLWLGLGSAFIAATARIGMVFDEVWHLDSIRVYTAHALPWFSNDVEQEGVGAISRSSSYLYHYVLSFPERWMADAGTPEIDRVIVLRLLTVAMHVGALLCMIGAVRAAGVSGAVANLAGIAYAALPVTPFLAAHVNYDSAMLLLVAACGWSAVRQWRSERVSWLGGLATVALGLTAVLVKFNAAPLVLVLFGFVLLRAIRGGRRPSVPTRTRGWVALGGAALVVAVLTLLCIERFVGNIVQFGAPSPDCALVLDAARCSTYGPWQRNEEADAAFADIPIALGTGAQFLFDIWIPRLMLYLQAVWFWFAPPVVSTLVTVAIPVAVISTTAIAVIAAPTAPRRRELLPLVLASVAFIAVLFWHNYSEWRAFGEPFGVQGRYLLPAVVPIVALAMHGAADSIRRSRIGAPILAIAAVAMVIVATQGGAAAWIVSSQGSWYAEEGPFIGVVDIVRRGVDLFVGLVPVPSI
ncbi:hypothetical protein LG314_10085 [Agrococcus terreus]|uniref:hypothetical protein n=1 Tax=Agrococcus terreus TaxID=574649 RepID=UPI00384DAA48